MGRVVMNHHNTAEAAELERARLTMLKARLFGQIRDWMNQRRLDLKRGDDGWAEW